VLDLVWRFSFSDEHRIAASVHASLSPVPFPPVTSDARDHHARSRSQARCGTHALNLLAQGRIRDVTVVFIGIHICFHLAPRFFAFRPNGGLLWKLFMNGFQMANAMFLVLLILLVIPTVSLVELRHLRYFAAVAAHGSFSRAANQLHLTQPALSR